MGIAKVMLTRIRSTFCSLVDETIPGHLYLVMRLSVAIVYFWFGFLKFPFVPGGDSATDLVGAWERFIDPDTFMLLLAGFETTAGALLLFNFLTPHVALLIMIHVCGTFLTLFLDGDQVFDQRHGLYALTLSGQYIIKNVLIFSSCLCLWLTKPRRHKRLPMRIPGRLKLYHEEYDLITRDISLAGLSFLVNLPDDSELSTDDRIAISLALPFEDKALEFQCRVVHTMRRMEGVSSLYVVGCEFFDKQEVAEILSPYLVNDIDIVVEKFATSLKLQKQTVAMSA